MSDTSKKQTFLHGAALLTAATALVKVIGALYKIPLNAIIGEQGFGYFNTAYQIYSVLLLISTTGLPVAASRMISQASALGHTNQVRRVFQTAKILYLSLGAVSTILMLAFCRQLAEFQGQPNAWAAIACLAPCAFLVCLLSTYRGFFQGQGNMIPTAVSEVIEAVCKLLVGIPTALIILNATNSVAYAAAGAIFGVLVGNLMGAFYMRVMQRQDYQTMAATYETPSSYRRVFKSLLSIAVPITIGSAGLQAMYLLEAHLFMGQLLTYNTQAQADTVKGIYDMALTIYNLPGALTAPITISIIPAITAHLTRCHDVGVRASEESAARVTALIAMPCAVGLMLLGEPVMALLGGYEASQIPLAGACLAVLGVGLYFYAVTQLTNAIMQAHGHATQPVIHILLAGVLKLGVVYVLVGNPNIGIVGVCIGSALCNLFVSVLNIIAIRYYVPQKPRLIRSFLRPLVPSIVMGGAAYGTWRGMQLLLGSDGSRLLLCAVPVAVGVIVYVAMAILCKSITREDCMLLPKGEKLADFLHL
ncbi:MAG TPA: polysaccharide biosynthesis protein [Candidatus Faecousia intestinigallinarum]|nr:polysaccharide biosynthesis protein [Candidatus Faecousia intestinigallinarum]